MIIGSGMTCVRSRRVLLASLAVVAALLAPGCKRQKPAAESSPSAQTVDDTGIVAMHEAMTQNLTAIAFDRLTAAHVGRRLVIKARTPDRADPPPPPLGMVRRMGDISIYVAELHEILPDGLKIRAAYPTTGNLKIIEIPRDDIQAIHLGK